MDTLTKDWSESEQMVLVCRRKDGSIAIHKFNATDEGACQLAVEAFGFTLKQMIHFPEVKATYNMTKRDE